MAAWTDSYMILRDKVQPQEWELVQVWQIEELVYDREKSSTQIPVQLETLSQPATIWTSIHNVVTPLTISPASQTIAANPGALHTLPLSHFGLFFFFHISSIFCFVTLFVSIPPLYSSTFSLSASFVYPLFSLFFTVHNITTFNFVSSHLFHSPFSHVHMPLPSFLLLCFICISTLPIFFTFHCIISFNFISFHSFHSPFSPVLLPFPSSLLSHCLTLPASYMHLFCISLSLTILF